MLLVWEKKVKKYFSTIKNISLNHYLILFFYQDSNNILLLNRYFFFFTVIPKFKSTYSILIAFYKYELIVMKYIVIQEVFIIYGSWTIYVI